MNRILSYIEKVPDYLRQEFSSRMLVCVIVLIVYLFVLFFSNKVAGVLRKIFIVACIGFAVIGGFRGPNKNGFEMICTAVLALILLGIIRLISYIIRTVRQNRIDARIEERALAKAAKRRGSFKNKQGYSGASKPIEDDYVPDEMSKEEIRDVVDNDEVSAADEKTAASFSENEEPQKAASGLSAAEKSCRNRCRCRRTIPGCFFIRHRSPNIRCFVIGRGSWRFFCHTVSVGYFRPSFRRGSCTAG